MLLFAPCDVDNGVVNSDAGLVRELQGGRCDLTIGLSWSRVFSEFSWLEKSVTLACNRGGTGTWLLSQRNNAWCLPQHRDSTKLGAQALRIWLLTPSRQTDLPEWSLLSCLSQGPMVSWGDKGGGWPCPHLPQFSCCWISPALFCLQVT